MRKSRNPAISIVLVSILMGFSVVCSRHSTDDKMAKGIQDKVAADPETLHSPVHVSAREAELP